MNGRSIHWRALHTCRFLCPNLQKALKQLIRDLKNRLVYSWKLVNGMKKSTNAFRLKWAGVCVAYPNPRQGMCFLISKVIRLWALQEWNTCSDSFSSTPSKITIVYGHLLQNKKKLPLNRSWIL